MAFYWMQMKLTYLIKGGIAKNDVSARGRSHETAAGPVTLLGVVPGGGRALETEIFKMLDNFRIKAPGHSRRDFEIFRPDPEMLAFIGGQEMKHFGYEVHCRPRSPKKETTKGWLLRVADICKGDARDAALFAITEYERLCLARPESARGGWDLNEMIGGNGEIGRQTVMGFASEIVDGKKWLIHRCTYNGSVFRFPVFYEWYQRENRRTPPAGSVRTDGIPIGNPVKMRLKASTRRLRETRRAERMAAMSRDDKTQLLLVSQ